MNPLECITRYALFALAPPDLLDRWLAAGQTVRLATGEPLFREGTPGEWAYVLLAGRIRVVRRSPSGDDLTLGLLAPGELFGEYALLPPGQNTAGCRAAADSVLLQLPLSLPRQWLARTPGLFSLLKQFLQLHFLLRYLREQPFLGFMSAKSALAMAHHLTPVEVPAERAVQADGLLDDAWLFLECGELLLDDGRTLGSGASLGAAGLIGGSLPTAVARTDAKLIALPRDAFIHPHKAVVPGLQSYSGGPRTPLDAYPWIGQREPDDCGAACLAMVARYHGLAVEVDDVRGRMEIGHAGATLGEMVRAATALGLSAQAVRVAAGQWRHVHTPAIVHLISGHYVVLFRLDAKGALLGDPAAGVVPVSVVHFAKLASGYVILPRPAHAA